MFSEKYRKIFAPRETAREGPQASPSVPTGRSPSRQIFYGIFLKTWSIIILFHAWRCFYKENIRKQGFPLAVFSRWRNNYVTMQIFIRKRIYCVILFLTLPSRVACRWTLNVKKIHIFLVLNNALGLINHFNLRI